jgi:hypothetical protein
MTTTVVVFCHAQRKKILAVPLMWLGREKMLSMGGYQMRTWAGSGST